jgi:uncharacterized protein
MATLARRRRVFGFGRHRDETEALQQQVTALESALNKCAEVAGRWTDFRREVTIAIAIACLVVGFVLGVYREPILRTVTHAVGLAAKPKSADVAYAAYQKGNYTAALEEALPLAATGDARAQTLMGLLYYRGRGASQDHAEAIRWFRRAADDGEAAAEFYLGVMFAEGQGVPQDYEEAVKWYRRAAARGDALAQYNLGIAYAKGEGVAADPVRAHMWLNVAAARFQGSDANRRIAAANNRDAVATKMTADQLAEAQRLAREWSAAR